MQTAIVCFNKEMDLWLKDYLDKEINHCSVVIEAKSNELTHMTWTGKRIEVMSGYIERNEYIKDVSSNGVLVVEYPIREDWTPCIGPFTCVSMVKRFLGLGPLSMYIVTPHQLYRYLRR